MQRLPITLPALLFVILACSGVAPADTHTWTGGGTTNNWSDPANWGGTVPTSGDSIVFAGTARLTPSNSFAAGFDVSGITFDSAAGAFTLTGNGIDMLREVINNSPQLQTIDLGIALPSTAQVFDTGAGGITVGGAISGSGALWKHGLGVLTLSGANTYAGATELYLGTLRVGKAGALPPGTRFQFSWGQGVLDLNGYNTTIAGLDGSGGTVSLGVATLTVNNSDVARFGGTITGTGGLWKLGLGPLWLSGENTYTGGTWIQGGTLVMGHTGGLVGNVINDDALDFEMSAGAIRTFAGKIFGKGRLFVAGYDYGMLILTGANTYTGSTVVLGTLRLAHAQALPGGTGASGGKSNLELAGNTYESGTGVIELAASDFLRGLGTSATQVQFTGSGGFSAYGTDRNVDLGGAAATVTWGASNFVPRGSTLRFSSPHADATLIFRNPINLGTDSNPREIWVDDGASTIDARLTGSITGNSGIRKRGAGTLELLAANAYSGLTWVAGGVLRLRHADALPASSHLEIGGDYEGGVLELAAGNFYRPLGDGPGQVSFSYESLSGFSAAGGTRIVNLGGASAPITWTSGYPLLLGLPTATGTLDFQNPISFAYLSVQVEDGSADVDAKLSGTISGSGTLKKIGLGTLLLTAQNTCTGPTQVTEGTLRLGAAGALPADSAVSVAFGAVLEIRGAEQTTNNGISGSGGVLLSDNRLIFNAAGDISSSAPMSGSGALSKKGPGKLTLSGTNTYTGATVVSSGILRFSTGVALPGGVGASGGTSNLTLDGGLVEIASEDFLRGLGTGPHQVQFAGSGGFSADTAARVVNLGGSGQQVVWGSGGFVPDGAALLLSAASGGNLRFCNPIELSGPACTIQVVSGLATLEGTLSGSGGLSKSGPGTLDLTTANTHAGATTASEGVLRLRHTNALPGGTGASGGTSNLTLSGGVVELGVGDFLRALGTGGDQAQFAGSGGFSAYGSNRTINFGGASAEVIWGGGGFVPDASMLILGSTGSYATIDLQNPVNLGNSMRTVQVENGSATIDAKLSGVLSGTGGLTKTGSGTLLLEADNTYTGGTTIAAGILQIGDGATRGSITGDVSNSASLVFNRADNFTFAGRISGSGSVIKQGSGTLTLSGLNT